MHFEGILEGAHHLKKILFSARHFP